MKTLAELLCEAERQEDAMTNPRLFLAIFPSGPRNGRFLDPYLGIMQVNGFEGIFQVGNFDLHRIQAIWAD
jgi:hypothetical protein